jgi:hypothetical protein
MEHAESRPELANRSAADRALELQHSELTRQREHEQMVAQIGRTER